MYRMNLSELLKRCYTPYKWHLKRYPDAAKKARIRKKWLNRFGTPLEDNISGSVESSFFNLIRNPIYIEEYTVFLGEEQPTSPTNPVT